MAKWNHALSRFYTSWTRSQAAQARQRLASDGPERLARNRARAQDLLRAARLQVLGQLAGPGTLEQCLATVLEHLSRAQAGHLAAICLVDPGSERLRVAAVVGLPESYRTATESLDLGQQAGSIAAAASGEGVVSEDLAIDPNWAQLQTLAEDAGLGACWAEPIHGASGRVLGVIATYARQPKSPDTLDLALLQEAARLAGMVIEHKAD